MTAALSASLGLLLLGDVLRFDRHVNDVAIVGAESVF